MSRIQSSVLSSAAPMLNLWADLTHQGFIGNQDELIPVKTVLEVCQQTLALVGNASSYISETRRSVIIDKVKLRRPRLASFLQDICKEDPGEPTKELFGPTFKKRITERAQTIKDFNQSLRSLDSPFAGPSQTSRKRFLGKDSKARYGSFSSLPKPTPYTNRRVFQPPHPKHRLNQTRQWPARKIK